MTGIDDLIICPRCLRPMGEDIFTMVCQYCGYEESEESEENEIDECIKYLMRRNEVIYK